VWLFNKIRFRKPLGRSGRRWEDNIRKDLGRMEWEGVDLIHVA